MLWLLQMNGVQEIPSVYQVKRLGAALEKLCGVETKKYTGSLGHTYYVNTIASHISMVSSVLHLI